ncbi:MAG: hypothetical protein BroJett029_04560 [Alphaproteobacteria bacterium]|nr:MAG: hypothetical protein BroJett029_04560 [Alphaproteobacteria bacterium]
MKQKQVFSRTRLSKGRRAIAYILVAAVLVVAAAAYVATRMMSGGEETVAALATETHFHGLAVDAKDPSRLYLATHHGLFVVDPAGRAQLVSDSRDDFMGFTPHPGDPAILYASGHPAGGGNTGFTVSDDGGQSWRKLAEGAGGPVDFHQMDVSKADPKVIYGVYGDIQKSTDGGQSWTVVAAIPQGLIDLAAGSRPEMLYAATQQGLLRSTDDGKSWKPVYQSRQPVTMVEVTREGAIYAFVTGTGLVQADEQSLNWKVLGGGFGGQYVLHFAVAASNSRRLYAITIDPADRSQSLFTSADGGESWTTLATP